MTLNTRRSPSKSLLSYIQKEAKTLPHPLPITLKYKTKNQVLSITSVMDCRDKLELPSSGKFTSFSQVNIVIVSRTRNNLRNLSHISICWGLQKFPDQQLVGRHLPNSAHHCDRDSRMLRPQIKTISLWLTNAPGFCAVLLVRDEFCLFNCGIKRRWACNSSGNWSYCWHHSSAHNLCFLLQRAFLDLAGNSDRPCACGYCLGVDAVGVLLQSSNYCLRGDSNHHLWNLLGCHY